jgi:hypothetical protein
MDLFPETTFRLEVADVSPDLGAPTHTNGFWRESWPQPWSSDGSPLKLGWRSTPSSVIPRNSIRADSFGSTHTVSFFRSGFAVGRVRRTRPQVALARPEVGPGRRVG